MQVLRNICIPTIVPTVLFLFLHALVCSIVVVFLFDLTNIAVTTFLQQISICFGFLDITIFVFDQGLPVQIQLDNRYSFQLYHRTFEKSKSDLYGKTKHIP